MLFAKPDIIMSDDWLPGNIENRKIYLASPYSSPSAQVRQERYEAALKALHFFIKKRCVVYSPIVHSHQAALMGDIPLDFNYWGVHCISFLDKWADEIWVLQIPGWDKSVGVGAELDFCASHERMFYGRMVKFL